MTSSRIRLALAGAAAGGAALAASAALPAAEYDLDPAHSFVEFRVQHLGYSWLYGRFNDVSGSFRYDADAPAESSISVSVDPASVDTNHAERDKHLRGGDFLDVGSFGAATFESTGWKGGAAQGQLTGDLTFRGVTREITINVRKLGEGRDPWGGYRAGFVGTWTMDRRDFGIDYGLGPKGWAVELELGIEGIRR